MPDSKQEIIRELRAKIEEMSHLVAALDRDEPSVGGAPSAPAERRTFDPSELLTVKQAAHLVPCHVRTLQRRIDEEPDLSIKVGGKRFVLRSELHRASSAVANCQSLSVALSCEHAQSPGHKNQGKRDD